MHGLRWLYVGVSLSLALVACGDPESERMALASVRSELTATYDPALRVPKCGALSNQCDTGIKVNGRANLGPEPSQPNTLQGTCADGTAGYFHGDESLDRLVISSTDGAVLTAGKLAKIDATVWAYSGYSSDALDLYFSPSATSPSWTLLKTITPPGGGQRVLSHTFTLPANASALSAIRGQFRYGGGTGPCVSGSYNDRDDLAFAVAPGTDTTPPYNVAISSPVAGQTMAQSFSVSATASDNVAVTRIDFLAEGLVQASDATAPFSGNLQLAPGTHSLQVRAFDAAGNATASALTTVTVNPAPTVQILAPLTEELILAPFRARADASDDTAVSRIDFYLGTSLVGSDYTPPYEMDVPANYSGHLDLRARAFDAVNNSTEASVPVWVDSAAPRLSINGQTFPPRTYRGDETLSANATDDVGVARVEYFADGALIGSSTTGPYYSIVWNTRVHPDGSQVQLLARAHDLAGRTGDYPLSVTVNNDTTPPTVALLAPLAGEVLRGTYTLRGEASDNDVLSSVSWTINGNVIASGATATWDSRGFANGSHTLWLNARDRMGNTAATSVPITVDNDLVAPTVSLSAPAANATVEGVVAITANASDNIGVTRVEFLVGGALVSTDVAAPYRHDWFTRNHPNGQVWIAARAYDAAGNSRYSQYVQVTVNNDVTPPTVGITSPANAATVSRTVQLSATASDDRAVASVQFTLDGQVIGTLSGPPYTLGWDSLTVPNGQHLIGARASDGALNVGETSVVVTVDNDQLSPSVVLTAPLAGARITGAVTVAANASDNVGVTQVEFLVDGAVVGTDVASPWSHTWTPTATLNGPRTLTARARDAAGNVTTSAAVGVLVELDDVPPQVSRAHPVAGDVIYGAQLFEITASDPSGLKRIELRVQWSSTSCGGALGVTATCVLGVDANFNPPGPGTVTLLAEDNRGNVYEELIFVTFEHDLTPPTVSLTQPAQGSTLTGPVQLLAEVTDDVRVNSVEFLVDGVAVATTFEPPHTLEWDSAAVADGPHTLSVVAWDSAYNQATAEVQIVTANGVVGPDTSGPQLTNGPAGGQVLREPTTWTVTASDPGGVQWVELHTPTNFSFCDGFPPGATSAVCEVTFDPNGLENGPAMLTLRSGDSFGNLVEQVVFVTVENDLTPPSVVITTPSMDAPLTGLVRIAAEVSDQSQIAEVLFIADGYVIGAATAPPWEVFWDTTPEANRSLGIVAHARDTAGNWGMSDLVMVHITHSVGPPELSGGPTEGEEILAPVTWQLTATDAQGVSILELLTPTGAITCVPPGGEPALQAFSCAATFDPTGVAPGLATLVLRAGDTTGLLSMREIQVFIGPDLDPPEPAVSFPVEGLTVYGTVELSTYIAEDRTVQWVEWILDGALVTRLTTPPFSLSWDTRGVPNGSHQVRVAAAGSRGGPTLSPPVHFMVDNRPLRIASPLPGAQVSPQVEILAESDVPVACVELFIDGVYSGTDFEPPFVFTPAPFAPGSTPSFQAFARCGSMPAHSVPVAVTVTDLPVSGPGVAEYDPSFGAPRCVASGAPGCDSSRLLFGRGPSAPFPGGEPNAPNTLDRCFDSADYDPGDLFGIDRILVETVWNEPLKPWSEVRVSITGVRDSNEVIDVFFRSEAGFNPWQHLGNYGGTSGPYSITVPSFVLSGAPQQAIRVVSRSPYHPPRPCPDPDYPRNDVDDLILDFAAP